MGATLTFGDPTKVKNVVAVGEPAAPIEQAVAAVRAKALFELPYVIVTPVTAALDVPVFARVMSGGDGADVTHVIVPPEPLPKPAAVRVVPVTWIWAELAEEPKTPNTKPPIATAAIRVTAMISTVAMMGEIALRGAYFPCGSPKILIFLPL